MQEFDYLSLFLLGLLGAGHCAGMCGPIVLSLPPRHGAAAQVPYNLGRIVTYGLLGGFLGWAGNAVSGLGWGGPGTGSVLLIQAGLTIVASVFLLLFGLARLGFIGDAGLLSSASLAGIPGFRRLGRRLARGQGDPGTYLLFGLLLGFLPCGLSYAAFTRCLVSGGFLQGLAGGLAFGAGTLPALLAIGLGASGFLRRHRETSEILSALLMIGMAIWLALGTLFPGS
jgi:hypothetical protein